MSFTVPKDEVDAARVALDPIAGELGSRSPRTTAWARSPSSAPGMKSHPGVAAKVFRTLGEHEINIEMISTSPIRISCVVPVGKVPEAVRALHAAFELSGPDTIRPEQPFGEFA
jgi:aspartate kinase